MRSRPLLCLSLAAVAPLAATGGEAWAQSPINLYGDTQYGLTHQAGDNQHAFAVPMLDLFSAQSIDRVQFLAEVVLEVNAENSFVLDVERVQVGYQFAEWLRVAAGRFHTALGYYNDAYHHGNYFVVPVERPTMAAFEDDGGLIPAHAVGIHADGRIALGESAGALRLDLDLSNGRGPIADAINNAFDSNRSKAWNFRLRWEAAGALDGLVVGGNFYLDKIAPDPAGMTPALRERIFGGHLAYTERMIHFVAEYAFFHHQQVLTGEVHDTHAFFAEAGYQLADFMPYLRYENTRFPSNLDPFFATAAENGSYQVYSAGVKWVFSANLALKLQGRVSLFDAPGVENMYDGVAQCAFAF